jgi:hypothetical protein
MTLQNELHGVLSGMMQQIEAGSEAQEDEMSLTDRIRRIDQLKEELGAEAPPMLQHFLEKRSYAKALDFLEGRDETSAPNC